MVTTRGSMIARLLLLGAACLATLGASRCSFDSGSEGDRDSGGGRLEIGDPGPGTGTSVGPTFSVTLTLQDASGRTTSRFARGELITFDLAVLNRRGNPIHLQLPTIGGNQDFQVFVPAAHDAEWNWLANKLFAAAVTEVTFDAGGTLHFTGTWDQVRSDGRMLERGTYEAMGRFIPIPGQGLALTDDDTQSPRVAFVID